MCHLVSSTNRLCVSTQGTSVARRRGGGADLDMAEELVEKDDQAEAVHPHILVQVILVLLHLRSGTCLVDLMQTWDSGAMPASTMHRFDAC